MRERLAQEVERTTQFERPLSVLVVKLESPRSQEAGVRLLRPLLKMLDVVGFKLSGENVALAVGRAFPHYAFRQRREHAERYLELLGILDCYRQMPAELSLGTQQCVSLARALSLEPRFLLLDEPFSQMDSLTRLDLQDTLLDVWEKLRPTVVMVTHDIDEGLYLADRLLLMTDGPEARVGEILQLPFARPRRRVDVLEHPEYYTYRSRIIDFLENHAHQFAIRSP